MNTYQSPGKNNCMRIKSKTASVVFKFIIAITALLGVMVQVGVFGNIHLFVFRMFTVLTNSLCCIYFAVCTSVLAADKARDGGDSPLPFIKGICTVCLTLTGTVAAAILLRAINFHSLMGVSMFLLHVITPLFAIADWLLFDKKGRIKLWMPPLWISAPLLYFGFIMYTAGIMDADAPLRFPYPFLDYENLGIPLFAAICLMIAVFYLLLGYFIRFIDRKTM